MRPVHRRQVIVPIIYDGITSEEGLRLDVLVEVRIICELKAVAMMNSVYEAQILSQMKVTGNRPASLSTSMCLRSRTASID
jgi:GxxExxY protein